MTDSPEPDEPDAVPDDATEAQAVMIVELRLMNQQLAESNRRLAALPAWDRVVAEERKRRHRVTALLSVLIFLTMVAIGAVVYAGVQYRDDHVRSSRSTRCAIRQAVVSILDTTDTPLAVEQRILDNLDQALHTETCP